MSPITKTGMNNKTRMSPITETGMSKKKKEWVLLQKLVWVKNKYESYYRNWYE